VGNVHVTALLIERGADVHSATQEGWTPLHGAAVEGELGTVRLLLERGADASAPSLVRAALLCWRLRGAACVRRSGVCEMRR
jgi:ankyrin repeat protein